jgi:uncharacterized protein
LSTVRFFFFFFTGALLTFNIAQAEFVIPPPPSDYIHDGAGLLSQGVHAQLAARLSQLDTQSGVQLLIATFPSLQDEAIEDVSLRISESWGIGHKGRDQGLVLAVFLADRSIRIEVGYGLENTVTDARAHEIIENIIKPAFRQNQFEAGLQQAVDALITLAQSPSAAPPQNSVDPAAAGAKPKRPITLIFGAFLILGICFLVASKFNRRLLWSELLVSCVLILVLGAVLGLLAGLVYMFVLGGSTTARADTYSHGGAQHRGYFNPWLASSLMGALMGGRGGGGGFRGFSGGGGGFGGGGASGRW